MIRFVPLFLFLGAPIVSFDALAGPPAEEMSPRQKAMHAIVQSEHDMVQGIVYAIEQTAEAKGSVPLSDGAKAHWKTAKELHKAAATHWEAKEWRQAYVKFREAAVELEPVMAEILDKPHPPEAFVAAVAAQVEETARQIDALADVVGPHVDDPEAKAAYADAKALHAEAKALWDDPGQGRRKEAAKKVWEAAHKLDLAIRKSWPEK